MAPWWRGPGLLLRRAGVVIALVAAALVATLPAAAVTPFLSSSRSATLHHQIASACQWSTGATISNLVAPASPDGATGGVIYGNEIVTGTGDTIDTVRRAEKQVESAAQTVPGLGPGESTLISPLLQGPSERPDNPIFPVYLVARDHAADHLRIVDGPAGGAPAGAGPSGGGVWISDEYADFAHLKVGDRMPLIGPFTFGEGLAQAHLTVTAIYHDLRNQPDQPWWCDLLKVYRGPQGNSPTPVVAFVDHATFMSALPQLRTAADHMVSFPLTDPRLGRDQAQRTLAGIQRQWGKPLAQGTSAPAADTSEQRSGVTSLLPQFVARADLARRSMLPAVIPITAAGVLVGLLVVAAAAVFWVQRRRRELTLLSAHGAGAVALALKAVAEALPALIAGAALGWGAAWALVRWAGPDPVLSTEAGPWAAAGAAGTLLAAALAVAVVAGLACRTLTDQVRARHHRVLRALPYELVPLAAAVPVWRWLGDNRVTGDPGNGLGTAVHVPGRLLIVPIMVVAGLTVLAARLGIGYLRRRGPRRRPTRPGAFLGWRRIGRQAVATAVLAGATSVPIALAVYGATVTGSVRTTIADEARLHTGSDVVLTLDHRVPIPASLAGEATEVLRLEGPIIGGVQTDVLAVDPATFARDAYWDSRLDGASLRDLLAPIRSESGTTPRGGPLTILASRQTPAGTQQATWAGSPVLGGTVQVASTGTLPAQRTGYPVALVPTAALGDDAQYADVQWWVRGDPGQIRAAVDAAKVPVTQILVAADRYGDSVWEPLTYTFDYLTALSLLTGVVTLVGLLLYLESQTPAYRRAYVLLRRMGLAARSHRRAILGELALPLLAGLIGGVVVAAALTMAVSADYDLNPDEPPATVIAVPYLAIGLIAAAVVVIAFAATGYAQRRIGRANPSEVLRDAV